jgi:hypothetical protein
MFLVDICVILSASTRWISLQIHYEFANQQKFPFLKEAMSVKQYLESKLLVRSLPGASLTVRLDVATCSRHELAFITGDVERDVCDRPIYANLFVCDHISDKEYISGVILHEFMHILAFTPESISMFRHPNGRPRVVRNPATNRPLLNLACRSISDLSSIPGLIRIVHTSTTAFVLLTTESVLRVAAPIPVALQIEETDSAGNCVSGHWWSSVFFAFDLMTAHPDLTILPSSQPRLSAVNLALLVDSGWYRLTLSVYLCGVFRNTTNFRAQVYSTTYQINSTESSQRSLPFPSPRVDSVL